MPKFSVEGWDGEHFKRTEVFAKQVRNIYLAAIREAIRLGLSVNYDPSKPFSFSKFPVLNQRVKKLFGDLSDKIEAVITDGINSEWEFANDKNDSFLKSVLKTDKIPERALARLTGRNNEALVQFQQRRTNGLGLSDRVWNTNQQFRSELEMALELGIADGRSADQLSRDIRSYLEDPDILFRRVRERENGPLRLSQHAKNYKPGRGVYRSSYKNALRLTRTEINMAYRESDFARWQNFDFVVGIEVRRSNNPYPCIVCESLKGRYPKTFKFRSWHPQCRCHAISILATEKEINEMELKMLNGEDTSDVVSENEVREMPAGFTSWVNDNKQRLLSSASQPYFIQDNFKGGHLSGGLKLTLPGDPIDPYITATRSKENVFARRSGDIAKDLGVKVTNVNKKSISRIMEKANADYGGDITQVHDIIRNTFISSTLISPDDILDKVNDEFQVIKVKEQLASNDQMGYSGILVQVLLERNIFAEIQINTPQMIYAKESNAKDILGEDLFEEIKSSSGVEHGLGHSYYEEYRTIDRSTVKGEELAMSIIEKSKKYYNRLRTVALESK